MQRLQRQLAIFIAAGIVITAAGEGSAFEGTLSLRNVTIDRAQLSKLAGGGQAAPADEVFAIPVDKLLALKDAGVKIDESTVYVSGSKLRAETPMPDDPNAWVIVDVDKNITSVVIPKEKRFIEWTTADAQAMSKEVERLRAKMKAQLAALPAEQRKQMEEMMKNVPGMSEEEGPKVALHPLGQTRMINGFQCSGYEVKVRDETTRGWVTKDLPDLAQIYRTSQDNLTKMLPGVPADPRTALGAEGLPVLVQTLGPERYRLEELVKVDKTAVAAERFVVPAGFKKTSAREEMRNASKGQP